MGSYLSTHRKRLRVHLQYSVIVSFRKNVSKSIIQTINYNKHISRERKRKLSMRSLITKFAQIHHCNVTHL